MSRMNDIFEKLLATFSKYLHHPLKKEKKLSTDTTVTERGGMEGWRGGANTSGSAQHDGRSSGRTESEAGWWWTGPPHRLPAGVGANPVRGVDHVNKIPQCDVMQAEGAMWSSDFSKAVRYFVRALHWLQSIKMFFPGMLLKFFFKNISTGMTSENFPNLLLSFHFALTSRPFMRFQEFLDWKPALLCSLFLSSIVPWQWIIFSYSSLRLCFRSGVHDRNAASSFTARRRRCQRLSHSLISLQTHTGATHQHYYFLYNSLLLFCTCSWIRQDKLSKKRW